MSPATSKATTSQPQAATELETDVMNAAPAKECQHNEQCEHNHKHKASRMRGAGAGKDCFMGLLGCFLCFECCEGCCECIADIVCCPCEMCC
ncbi:hypothetical protein FB45DRAFT_280885 [Roridomyces roridus]|uniref:Cysteine-rich transmembrane CYSTM domain-containing protein n=1 Tax=Roridomyces roridus TaxID=1738132 RepID=A0AAD7CAI4_9AGAR|nr:hypothetical protein FB45DRAFT_280885 [Roridomyces roridus]